MWKWTVLSLKGNKSLKQDKGSWFLPYIVIEALALYTALLILTMAMFFCHSIGNIALLIAWFQVIIGNHLLLFLYRDHFSPSLLISPLSPNIARDCLIACLYCTILFRHQSYTCFEEAGRPMLLFLLNGNFMIK